MKEPAFESGNCPASGICPEEIRNSFRKTLKQGIYKELHRRAFLSDEQLDALLQHQETVCIHVP